jgi:hypothetical protein
MDNIQNIQKYTIVTNLQILEFTVLFIGIIGIRI